MKAIVARGSVAIAAAVTVLLAGGTPDAQTSISASCSGSTANLTFTLNGLDGKSRTLSVHRGKVIILNFWATWCAPCRIEIPEFVDLYNRYRSRGLEVIGINVDGQASTAKRFAAELRINYPVLLEEQRHEVREAYAVAGLPTTVVITRDGLICQRYLGYTPKATLEELINRLM